MIEFNGRISGVAEKWLFKRAKDVSQKIVIAALLLVAPTLILYAIKAEFWMLIGGYIILSVITVALTFIPKSKKEKLSQVPKRIYVEEDTIVCVADGYTQSAFLKDVKQVNDYGEFYELVFPFGKISTCFICQKNLITKGTIEEFEALFEGKIVRKNMSVTGGRFS